MVAWISRQCPEDCYLSVVSIGEIERGIARKRQRARGMPATCWGCWRGCTDLLNQPMLIRTPVRTPITMSESRFEVRLNQRLADDFDQVARSSSLSRAEVFRRAIALYKTVKQEEVQQGHVILRSRDGAERELVNF